MTHTTCARDIESGEASILATEVEAHHAWHERVFHDLTEVAELLDSLEACEVSERKLYSVAQGLFLVRWRV